MNVNAFENELVFLLGFLELFVINSQASIYRGIISNSQEAIFQE